MWTVDLGCGTYCRCEVGVDIQFWHRNPHDRPELFDNIVGGLNPHCDRVLADLNYPLPFRDSFAIRIVMRAVLEHLECPFRTLLEVKRILKQGGKVLIVVPNARVSQADWRDPSHLYSWTEASLRNLLSKIFRKVEVKVIMNGESLLAVAEK